MNKQRLLNIADLLIEFFYSAIVFLTPLFFAFFLSANNVFTLSKIVFFKVLVSLLSVVFILKAAVQPSCRRGLKERIRGGKYVIIPLLFILSLAVSTLFSQYPELGFFGLYSRQEGLASYLYYFVFFLLLLFVIRDFGQLRRLFLGAGLSSLVVSSYALLQVAGVDIFQWTEPAVLTGRATSTLGQPNYLGSYLLLALPFPLYLLYKHRTSWQRYLWGMVVVFDLAALYFTKSSAAGAGLAAGVLSVVLAYLWFSGSKYRRIVLFGGAGLTLAVILAVGGAFVVDNKKITEAEVAKRGDVALRMNFWRSSWRAIGERPLLGYGPDSQNNIFVRYYDKDWAVHGDVNTIPSRAHNVFLDVLLIGGLLGFILYLLLLYLFVKLFRENFYGSLKAENKEMQAVNLLLLGGFAGYIVFLLFGFAVVTTHVYFWFYLAVLAALNRRLQKSPSSLSFRWLFDIAEKVGAIRGKYRKKRGTRAPFLMKVLLFIVVITLSGAQIDRQLDHLKADHYFKFIKIADGKNEYFQTLELHSYIKQLNIRDHYYDREVSLILAGRIEEMKDPLMAEPGKRVLHDALDEIKDSLRYDDIYARSQIYTALASAEEPRYFELAEQTYRQLLAMAGEVPRVHQAYGKMLAKEGRHQEALTYHQEALDRLPATDHPYMNRKHTKRVKYEKYLNYKAMADIYFTRENYEEAREYYRLAYNNNLSKISLYKKIADTYYKQGDLDKAIRVNKRGYTRDGEDHTWPFVIALLYKEKGNKDRALEYGEEALGLDPDNEKIKEFVHGLR